MARRTRVSLALFSIVTLALVASLAARSLDMLPEGLTATYFADENWGRPQPAVLVDSHPSRESLLAAWHGQPPPSFSTTWLGSLFVVRSGTYAFSTVSDDGSWVYVDGRLVVDNGGSHGSGQAAGRIDLAPGVHELFVKYFQHGGDLDLDLRWSRDSDPPGPIPSWMLFPRHVDVWRGLAHVVARRADRVVFLVWLATCALCAAFLLQPQAAAGLVRLRADAGLAVLAGIVTASAALNLIASNWGLPSFWAGDEITPPAVIMGLAQRFSHGWFDRYPPLHFEVLSLAFSPWLFAIARGWIELSTSTQTTLSLVGRFVSVAASAGTLIATYACGVQVFGRRAGVIAAAMLALVPMFVFYSKTANPEAAYVFWFSLSLLCWLRWLRTFSPRDAMLLAVTAAAAVCTKDQAYALYLGMPPVMAVALWRRHRAQGVDPRRALARSVFDRRLWYTAALAAVLFVLFQNLPFNVDGFLSHVRLITGPASHDYRIVEPTLAGRLTLLRYTVGLDQRAWGWPLWIAVLGGLVAALAHAKTRRVASALIVVAVSYYVCFVNVVLYDYDRFLLPICVVQALFGGFAIDRWLGEIGRRSWRLRAGLAGAVFAYSLLYAATVDALMLDDSRYTVERWLRARVAPDQQIGHAFPPVVLPRLDAFRSIDIGDVESLQRWTPAYFVLNADYARAVAEDSPIGRLIARLRRQDGDYAFAFRYRSPSPWPWLPAPHADLLGPRLDTPVLSFLRDINPTIEVYERVGAPGTSAPQSR